MRKAHRIKPIDGIQLTLALLFELNLPGNLLLHPLHILYCLQAALGLLALLEPGSLGEVLQEPVLWD